jgi:Acetyltransferase (GNAT) domain
MKQNKLDYIELCQRDETIPIFMQNGWLDAVITEGSSWQVVLSKDNKGQIIGALTFEMKKKWGLTILSEPPLSPFCGIWFKKKDTQKQHEQYHFVKIILVALIQQLPSFHFANFRFSTTLTDWQPFHWAGFQQTTRYTYHLDLKKTDNLFADFKHHTQRNIRKAEQYFHITHSDDLNTFLAINNKSFERQNLKSPIPYSIWLRVDAYLKKTGQRVIYFALNTDGGVEAAIYIVFDKKTAYYLAGGTTEIGRQQGATYLLLAQAIRDAQEKGLDIFDFEGSMLKGIESFFRGFNPTLTPYFKVWKYKNRFLSLLDLLRK